MGGGCAPAPATAALRRADASGLARTDGWAAGASTEVPREFLWLLGPAAAARRPPARVRESRRGGEPVGAALEGLAAGRELDERDVTALLEARGAAARAVLV